MSCGRDGEHFRNCHPRTVEEIIEHWESGVLYAPIIQPFLIADICKRIIELEKK